MKQLLPQAQEAEASLLSAVIINNRTFLEVEDVLNPDIFYIPAHGIIWQAMTELRQEDTPIDLVTLVNNLREKELLEKAGGASYLASLLDSVPLAVNAPHYADIVRQKWVLREIIRHGEAIKNMAIQTEDASETLDYAEKSIFNLSLNRKEASEPVQLAALLPSLLTDGKIREKGISTGFAGLDTVLGGLHPSDLVILAARPSMGKTSLALNIAANIASEKTVAVFSLEMSSEQISLRLLCSEGKIDMSGLTRGYLCKEDTDRLTCAAESLTEKKLFLDDSAAVSSGTIRSKSRRIKMKHGLGLIIVDYVQLMKTSTQSERRDLEIGEISRALKQLAKELEVPVLLLSQLNRKVEERTDRRPLLSDLRESGALEQDADVVMFIYREEIYNRNGRDENGNPAPDPAVVGIAEVIVAKHRNGPIGTVPMRFMKAYTKFTDIQNDYEVAA